MSIAYSLAQRSPSLNSVFAGLACALALTLTAGPALAESTDMQRVEVHGRVVDAPVRYDVHARCQNIEGQLQGALAMTWFREQREGNVKVQFVMENGQVTSVGARGVSLLAARDVRQAVSRLSCDPQNTAGAEVYRFNVEFIDPASARAADSQMASAGRPVAIRLASVND